MDSAVLLSTLLSVLLVWGFLTALVLGLLFILKPLQSVRGSLERIAMGVRAIEHQSGPLGRHAAAIGATVEKAAPALRAVGGDLERVAGRL